MSKALNSRRVRAPEPDMVWMQTELRRSDVTLVLLNLGIWAALPSGRHVPPKIDHTVR